jgi:hypothetical protein
MRHRRPRPGRPAGRQPATKRKRYSLGGRQCTGYSCGGSPFCDGTPARRPDAGEPVAPGVRRRRSPVSRWRPAASQLRTRGRPSGASLLRIQSGLLTEPAATSSHRNTWQHHREGSAVLPIRSRRSGVLPSAAAALRPGWFTMHASPLPSKPMEPQPAGHG